MTRKPDLDALWKKRTLAWGAVRKAEARALKVEDELDAALRQDEGTTMESVRERELFPKD